MVSTESPDDETRQAEGLPDIDTLRGPNTTPKLAQLIEGSTKFSANAHIYSGYGTTVIQHAITELQGWAGSIDREVVKASTLTVVNSKASLERMVKDLVDEGTISSSLDLMQLFLFMEKPRVARQDQWSMVEALFGIDNRALAPGHTGGLQLPGAYQLEKVHDYMVQLVSQAVQRRGHKLEDITTPEQKDWKQRSFSAPTVIDGVSATLTTRDIGFLNATGYPNIIGASLKFSPSFLASVRPLTREELLKYFPQKEKQQSNRQQGEERQSDHGQRKEEPRSERRERTEGFRRAEGGQDPRDPEGYYKTLGVNPDTDPEDLDEVILAAYRRLSRKYHADTGGETANHQKMVEINKAYEFLQKEINRRNYGRRF